MIIRLKASNLRTSDGTRYNLDIQHESKRAFVADVVKEVDSSVILPLEYIASNVWRVWSAFYGSYLYITREE